MVFDDYCDNSRKVEATKELFQVTQTSESVESLSDDYSNTFESI